MTQPQFTDETTERDFDTDVEPTAEDFEAAEADLDVDATPDDDAEEVVEAGTAEAPKDEKAAKEKKSTRPPVPEGFIAPVAFAKVLSEHLTAKAKELDPNAEAVEVKPQVVYSYIKNNGPKSKNPFPAFAGDDTNPETGQPYAPGRAVVLKAEDGLKWWDEKNARVAASKQAQAEKKAKKDEKTAKGESAATATVEAEAETAAEVTEAE